MIDPVWSDVVAALDGLIGTVETIREAEEIGSSVGPMMANTANEKDIGFETIEEALKALIGNLTPKIAAGGPGAKKLSNQEVEEAEDAVRQIAFLKKVMGFFALSAED
jgi:hypothetical protein